jgi:hypothetical protein
MRAAYSGSLALWKANNIHIKMNRYMRQGLTNLDVHEVLEEFRLTK